MTLTRQRAIELARVALIVAAAWMAHAVFWTLVRAYGRSSLPVPHVTAEFYANTARGFVWALVTPFLLYGGRRLLVRRPHRARNILLLTLLTFAVSAVRALASSFIVDGVAAGELLSFPLFVNAYDGMFEAVFIVLATQYLTITSENAERLRVEAALSAEIARARLRQLRGDLHPHLVFNALNSVAALAGDRPAEAARVLRVLSDLLQRSFACTDERIRLSDELGFIAPYLEIQQVRFRDRLRVAIDVPEELANCLVPPLILQPLVENAVIHGVTRHVTAGSVTVEARRSDGWLHLSVRDSGAAPTDAPRERPGIGIANVRARLQLLYGDRQELRLERAATGFTATVVIPMPHEATYA